MLNNKKYCKKNYYKYDSNTNYNSLDFINGIIFINKLYNSSYTHMYMIHACVSTLFSSPDYFGLK